ncbi:MAG: DUF3945 domain-containing protein [Prevotellaceae bacterium]|jgi:hypothetical protein|nr:DUF3945 domain-containing protein [Prevotellaceae bacterium]
MATNRKDILNKHTEIGNNRQSFTVPDEMPNEIINELKKWDILSESPYSFSFYNSSGKSWNNTPDGILRVSDHWNFETEDHKRATIIGTYTDEYGNDRYEKNYELINGGYHEKTNIPVNKGFWTLTRYSAESKTYEVILSVPPKTFEQQEEYRIQRLRNRNIMFSDEQFEKILEISDFIEEKKRNPHQSGKEQKKQLDELLKGIDFLNNGQYFKVHEHEALQIKNVNGVLNLQELGLSGYYRNLFDKGALVVNRRELGERLREWVKSIWEWMGSKLGIRGLTSERLQSLTLDQFGNRAVADLMGGKKISPMGKVSTQIGGVKLTADQRNNLKNGSAITVDNVKGKDGTITPKVTVALDKKTGKVKIVSMKVKYKAVTPKLDKLSKVIKL